MTGRITASLLHVFLCGFLLLALEDAPCRAQGTSGSVQGTVSAANGAVIRGARVTLTSEGTGQQRQTITDNEGKFIFRDLVLGSYDLQVEVAGFQVQRRKGIAVGIGEASTLSVTLDQGQRGPVRTIAAPLWNVWTEVPSANPAFRPVPAQANRDYSLVINLSALLYSDFEPGVYSKVGSSAFSNWLKRNNNLDSADVDLVVIADRRFFAPQSPNEIMKPLSINLKKIRSAQNAGFRVPKVPFDELHSRRGDTPFNFGSQVFRIRTRSTQGLGGISVSIWAGGKPVDELSIRLCIARMPTDSCKPGSEPVSSLEGVDLSSSDQAPNAALHLIDRQSDIVGVYRCNTCGWEKGDYKVWHIEEPAQWFADRIKEILALMAQQPDPRSGTTIDQILQSAGDNLHNTLFHSDEPEVSSVTKSLADLVTAARAANQSSTPTPTLFVRLIQTKPELVLAPIGLMRVELADHSKEFLGSYLNVQSPLEYQDYSKPPSCVSDWMLFVPPEETPPPPSLRDVSDARSAFSEWIATFRQTCPACVTEKENDFEGWLSGKSVQKADALIMLSHHGANSLYFYDGGSPAVHSTSITRSFSIPSLAIIDACGTSQPGASEFVREFNAHGINAVIATSTEVEPTVAGRFLSLLMDLLQSHRDDSTYTISRARFDAVRTLSGEYGARALAFVLAGNGSLRACVPDKKVIPAK